MGTLTAEVPRLSEYCPHKLSTSCRLSSIPNCCACADERAHTHTYLIYVDGVGLVPRGTRWQAYCWFCKEFWDNRVAATNLRPVQTRIPKVPDQIEFLKKWYDYYRGYRVVQEDDGTEERIALLGEPWEDVSPGHLPRSLDELRDGVLRSAVEEEIQVEEAVTEEQAETEPSLDETIDQMLEQAVAEETSRDTPSQALVIRSQPPVAAVTTEESSMNGIGHPQALHNAVNSDIPPTRDPGYQARRVAALRREMFRLPNGIDRVISGLRELGEQVPESSQATNRLTELGQTLDRISGSADNPGQSPHDLPLGNSLDDRYNAASDRLDILHQRVREARQAHTAAAEELEETRLDARRAGEVLRRLAREQQVTDGYTRFFGTREDIERQGDDHESPIGGMFTRAWERFRVAEEVRQEERNMQQPSAEERRESREIARSTSTMRTGSNPLESWAWPAWDNPDETARALVNEYIASLEAEQMGELDRPLFLPRIALSASRYLSMATGADTTTLRVRLTSIRENLASMDSASHYLTQESGRRIAELRRRIEGVDVNTVTREEILEIGRLIEPRSDSLHLQNRISEQPVREALEWRQGGPIGSHNGFAPRNEDWDFAARPNIPMATYESGPESTAANTDAIAATNGAGRNLRRIEHTRIEEDEAAGGTWGTGRWSTNPFSEDPNWFADESARQAGEPDDSTSHDEERRAALIEGRTDVTADPRGTMFADAALLLSERRRPPYMYFDNWPEPRRWVPPRPAGPVGLDEPSGPVGADAPSGPVGLDTPFGSVDLNEVSDSDGLDAPSGPVGLDAPSRPAPLEESALTIALECKICYAQLVPYHQHDQVQNLQVEKRGDAGLGDLWAENFEGWKNGV
ncbi:hypothetical protein B0A49_11610 [Cryomyces minteri]|uniref:Uncharacterized protein n=1 Tax=Cryomyces minteri TaxID=331657 RepID=A0A4U0WP22_9PEZI|nr:hypothetical protein B0A49_11610 [Cryomyces minteri]